MAKSINVSLGGTGYKVPMLDIGQLEEVGEILEKESSPIKRTFAVLRVAMRRSDPSVPDVGTLEADGREVKAAVEQVLELSGLIERKAPAIPNSEAPSAGA